MRQVRIFFYLVFTNVNTTINF